MIKTPLATGQAVTAYPQLERLFTSPTTPDNPRWDFHMRMTLTHEFRGIFGVREWPDGETDAIGIKSPSDARGSRHNPLGDLVNETTGTLEDVIDRMLELVPPWHPLAPRLLLPRVIGMPGLRLIRPNPPPAP